MVVWYHQTIVQTWVWRLVQHRGQSETTGYFAPKVWQNEEGDAWRRWVTHTCKKTLGFLQSFVICEKPCCFTQYTKTTKDSISCETFYLVSITFYTAFAQKHFSYDTNPWLVFFIPCEITSGFSGNILFTHSITWKEI